MTAKHLNTDSGPDKNFRFTVESIDQIPVPSKRTYYYDTHNKASGLGITALPSGNKTYHVRCTLEGKTSRVGLGKVGALKIEQARKLARAKVNEIASGENPIAAKKARRTAETTEGLTVHDAVERFCKERRRKIKSGEKVPLKESTKNTYRLSIKSLLGKRYEKPIMNLDEKTIKRCVEKTSSASVASSGCRSLSSVWAWLSRQEAFRESMKLNPVKEYSRYNEGLHRCAPRQRRIEREELPEFFGALDDCSPLIAEFYLWLLLTGARAGEAVNLQWEDIDWRRKIFRLEDPKNRVPVELPIPSVMIDKLNARKKLTGRVFATNDTNCYQRNKIAKRIGKHWSRHDLRRTFSGIAAAAVPYTSVKRLMNHSYSDITEQYIGASADLVAEIDKVQHEIFKLAGRPLGNVVKLERVK
jgi:integrase